MPEPSRARSRLQQTDSSPAAATHLPTPAQTSPTSEKKKKTGSKYLRHLPTLLLSAPGYGIAIYLMINVPPASIRHFLVPNAYLPLLASLGWGHFWLGSFLLLNTRRGFLLASLASSLSFLHLAQVIWTPQLLLLILVFFGILEATAIGLQKLATR